MCREFYSVRKNEKGEKYIEYHGFFWPRDNADEERDPQTGELLDYAFTDGKIDRVYLSDVRGDPFEHVMSKFEACQQYQKDMSEGEHFLSIANFYAEGDCGVRLHMSDVCADTPCGDYFFDNGTDKPRFTYIPSKTYAAYTDVWDGVSHDFLAGFLAAELPEKQIDFESDEFFECCFELTREFLIPTLERFGFDERPDGTDF